MPPESDILEACREAASKRILFLPHAIRQMARPDRMITTTDIRSAIFEGETIEDYPEDARGHSCLLLGFDAEQRPIHIVCSPKTEYLAIITAYVPDADDWSVDFRIRT
jgi:hypothetical protein